MECPNLLGVCAECISLCDKGNSNHHGTGEYIEVKVNHGIWEDYLQYGPQYDTANDCPIIPGETEFVERQRLNKLSKDTKTLLRDYMAGAVEKNWESKHQIPTAGDLKAIRSEVLNIMLSEHRVYLKDDKAVSSYLNNIVAPTINRLLRNERS